MTKESLLKLKKALLVSALNTTALTTLAGCTNAKDDTVDTSEKTNIEVTVDNKETDAQEEKIDYRALACEFERNYTQYVSETGLAYYSNEEQTEINIDRIENIIKVINGEVADITSSDVTTAARDIEQILIPQDLNKACNFIYREENGFLTIEGNFDLCEAPKLSIYAKNEETKEYLERFETLRDELINEINSTGTISDETKAKFEKATVEMELEYLNSKNYANTDTSSEGNKLLLSIAKLKTIELTNYVTDKARIYADEFPGGLKLAPETYDEVMVITKYDNEETRYQMTEAEKKLYTKITLDLIRTPIVESICAHEELLGRYADNNQNIYSSIDDDNMYAQIENYTLSL